MRDRSEEILEAAVREFISSGEPISSGHLYKRYGFGIKPAMIRLELCNLTDEGYLTQPYHSAGRVPSDMGYRFFAERILESAGTDSRSGEWEKMLEGRNWQEMLRNFSRDLGLVGVLAHSGSQDRTPFQEIYKDGLENLFSGLDTDSRTVFSEVVRDIEEIDDRLIGNRSLFNTDDFLEVFVGKNPVTKSEHLSVMAADYDVGGDRIIFFAIGPKRMDYEKTAKALKGMKLKNKKVKRKSSGK